MAAESIDIPATLHRGLAIIASQQGQSLDQVVCQLLQDGLERASILRESEPVLLEAYRAMSGEYARLAEESVRYVTEVLDPDEDWSEYQE